MSPTLLPTWTSTMSYFMDLRFLGLHISIKEDEDGDIAMWTTPTRCLVELNVSNPHKILEPGVVRFLKS